MNFNKVIIKNVTQQPNNIHIAVHPFPIKVIRMMMYKGDYEDSDYKGELSQWQKELSDKLFDNIPGLSDLFFDNGNITIQHSGVFSDPEIYNAAVEIIEPYLKSQLALQSLENKTRGE